jgi:hypothetical protein
MHIRNAAGAARVDPRRGSDDANVVGTLICTSLMSTGLANLSRIVHHSRNMFSRYGPAFIHQSSGTGRGTPDRAATDRSAQPARIRAGRAYSTLLPEPPIVFRLLLVPTTAD